MDVFRASLDPVDFWQRMLVAYTIALGVEAPVLLFFSSLHRRPWYEQALALLPAVGFGVALYLARQASASLAYVTFQQAHYPPRYWPTFARDQTAETQALVDNLHHQVMAMGGVTLVLLLGGGLLLLRWLPAPRRAEQLTPSAAQSSDDALSPDEEQGNLELEITREPIEND